jgi:hypothetical protein
VLQPQAERVSTLGCSTCFGQLLYIARQRIAGPPQALCVQSKGAHTNKRLHQALQAHQAHGKGEMLELHATQGTHHIQNRWQL